MTRRSQIALLAALFFATSMWFYVERILIPYQKADAAKHSRPRGNFSDLYPRWLGARELLLNHRDPYSSEVTNEIQLAYYGRALDSSRTDDPKDQQAFAYPLYVIFLLAPTIAVPFPVVQVCFLWFLLLLTALSVLLWVRTIGWKLHVGDLVTLMVLVVASFPVIQGIKLQQLTLFVTGLIAICAALLVRGRFLSAGWTLAFATIKPQLTVLLVGWLLLWAFSNWQERKKFIYGFGLMMTLLFAGAQAALPGWFSRFLDGLVAYQDYTGGLASTLDHLLSPFLGRPLALGIVVGLAVICWKTRHASIESSSFMLSTSLVLAVTVTVVPMVSPYNQVLLLPAIFLLLKDWRLIHPERLSYVFAIIVIALLFWPWLVTVEMMIASVFASSESVQRGWAVPLYTTLLIPPAVLALMFVYRMNFLNGKFKAGSVESSHPQVKQ